MLLGGYRNAAIAGLVVSVEVKATGRNRKFCRSEQAAGERRAKRR
jgi:hypothetical protein